MSSDVATAIQAIASVLNLGAVIIFFVWERFSGRKVQKREKEEFWYRETLLNRGMDMLNSCFDELEKILKKENEYNKCNSEENEQHIKQLVNEAKNQIGLLKRSVLLYTKLFDTNLTNEIRACTNRLEDGVSEGMETCYFSGTETRSLIVDLENYKYEMVSKLYKYDTGK